MGLILVQTGFLGQKKIENVPKMNHGKMKWRWVGFDQGTKNRQGQIGPYTSEIWKFLLVLVRSKVHDSLVQVRSGTDQFWSVDFVGQFWPKSVIFDKNPTWIGPGWTIFRIRSRWRFNFTFSSSTNFYGVWHRDCTLSLYKKW